MRRMSLGSAGRTAICTRAASAWDQGWHQSLGLGARLGSLCRP